MKVPEIKLKIQPKLKKPQHTVLLHSKPSKYTKNGKSGGRNIEVIA